MMQAYIGDYLKEEIAAEALTRNVPAFSRFLEVAALSNGEVINFNNIARDRVPRRTSDGIDILPWSIFLAQLWAGELTA